MSSSRAARSDVPSMAARIMTGFALVFLQMGQAGSLGYPRLTFAGVNARENQNARGIPPLELDVNRGCIPFHARLSLRGGFVLEPWETVNTGMLIHAVSFSVLMAVHMLVYTHAFPIFSPASSMTNNISLEEFLSPEEFFAKKWLPKRWILMCGGKDKPDKPR